MLTVSAGSAHIAPIEPGTYPAYCYGLIDLGEQYNEKYAKWARKVLIMWEIADRDQDLDLGGDHPEPRTISQQYTASINERAALRRDLTSWRGRDFTPAELQKFDLHSVVGAPCMLSIVHREYNNNTYAAISAITKLPKGLVPDDPVLERIVFDLDTSDLKMMELMPEWVENKIKESKQYKERTGTAPQPVDIDELDLPTEPDDDVPF